MTTGRLLAGPATGTTADGRPVWRVPLADFLAQVRPAYGGPDWDDVVRSVLADADERERVGTLAALVPGGFRQPVIVDDEDRALRNGMHRVVATILAGGSHLDVTDRYSTVDRPQLRVEFALELPPAHPYEDVHEAASSFLWSFPVGEEWAETDCMYDADPLIGGYWYWPADRTEDLVAAMTARAAARGAGLRVHVAEPHEPDEEEDD
ncbi:hypothetical protein [Blastococcus sp. SYSU D01042]